MGAERRLARLRPRRPPRRVRHQLPRVRRGEVPLVLCGRRLPRPPQLQRGFLRALPQQRRRHLHRRHEEGGRREAGRARHERGGGRPEQRRLARPLRRQRLDGELLLREPGRRDLRGEGARARPRARSERTGRLVDGPGGGGPRRRRPPRHPHPGHGLRQPALEGRQLLRRPRSTRRGSP